MPHFLNHGTMHMICNQVLLMSQTELYIALGVGYAVKVIKQKYTVYLNYSAVMVRILN